MQVGRAGDKDILHREEHLGQPLKVVMTSLPSLEET